MSLMTTVSSTQTNNLDGCDSMFTPKTSILPITVNPNNQRQSQPISSTFPLPSDILHSLATMRCFVMLAVAASQRLLRSSYTKAFSRSAESLSKTFKSFPSATDSCVLLAELHCNILACFI